MKKTVSVFDYKTGVDFLSAVHKSITDGNPRFSLRSFAQKIDIDQSSLVRYLRKVRLLSSEKTQTIAEKLKLNEVETHYFKLLTIFGDKGEFEILTKLRAGFLFEEQSERLDEPGGSAFLSNIDMTMNFKAHIIFELQNMAKNLEIGDIAQILGRFFDTDEKQVNELLHKLIQVGFINESDKKRRQELLSKIFLRTDQLPREVGVRFHSDALRVGLKAMENFAKTDVDIYTSLISIKEEGREKLLEAVKQLHSVISEYHADSDADAVFVVSSFIVNLTEGKDRDKKKLAT